MGSRIFDSGIALLRRYCSSQKVLQFQSLGILLATVFCPVSLFPAPTIGVLPALAPGWLALPALLSIRAAFQVRNWV
jgi:hypothetical protein